MRTQCVKHQYEEKRRENKKSTHIYSCVGGIIFDHVECYTCTVQCISASLVKVNTKNTNILHLLSVCFKYSDLLLQYKVSSFVDSWRNKNKCISNDLIVRMNQKEGTNRVLVKCLEKKKKLLTECQRKWVFFILKSQQIDWLFFQGMDLFK